MYGDPTDGAALTLIIPKFAKSPMKGPAVREYAREKPQNIHWKVVLAKALGTMIRGHARSMIAYTAATIND